MLKTSERLSVVAVAILLMLVSAGCGGGQGSSPPPPPPPPITLKSLSANYQPVGAGTGYAIAGQGNFTLTAYGSGFTRTSQLLWNGNALTTTYTNETDLDAAVPGSLGALPGTASISVKDPSSGAVSNVLPFGIASPAEATVGVAQLITVAPDGTPANDETLTRPAISATGRFVSFQSRATNLVPGPASGNREIYERDTCIGAPVGCVPNTIRITVTYDGSAVNGGSFDSAISADGRYVAFDSTATNILSAESSSSSEWVFLRDTCIGMAAGCTPQTILISVAPDGMPTSGGFPSISPDGRFVAFVSGTAIPNEIEVFLRDTCFGAPVGCTPSTTLVSGSTSGETGNAASEIATISANGRYVAFQSLATNLVNSPPPAKDAPAEFVRDTCVGASACSPITYQVDLASNGTQSNGAAFNLEPPAITPDGRFVAFSSNGTNLMRGAPAGSIFLRDTCSGASSECGPSTGVLSLGNDGSFENCGSDHPTVSANGRFYAFQSIATNLTPDWPAGVSACGWESAYVRDTCFGVASGCTPSTVNVAVTRDPNGVPVAGSNTSWFPVISADGHYVAFVSNASNFVPGGGNGYNMVFLAKTGF